MKWYSMLIGALVLVLASFGRVAHASSHGDDVTEVQAASSKTEAKKPEVPIEVRMATVESRMQTAMEREIHLKYEQLSAGMGFKPRVERLAELLGVKKEGPMMRIIPELQKKMGIEPSEGEGIMQALQKIESQYFAEQLKEKFETEYGIPGKMQMVDRIKKAEAFFDKRYNDSIAGWRPTWGDHDRIELVQTRFPEVTTRLGSTRNLVEAFEKEYQLKPEGSYKDRIIKIESIADSRYSLRLNLEREETPLSQRVDALLGTSNNLPEHQ